QCGAVAGHLHPGLCRGVRLRHGLHPQHAAPRPAAARAGARYRGRRPHARAAAERRGRIAGRRSALMPIETWLPVVWFGVIGFGVLMYVVLDGFVLGLGILAPFADDSDQLDLMMNTAAPIWDGNETWLVLGGVGLLAAFRSEEHTSELQSRENLVCRLLLEKKKGH